MPNTKIMKRERRRSRIIDPIRLTIAWKRKRLNSVDASCRNVWSVATGYSSLLSDMATKSLSLARYRASSPLVYAT